MLLLGVKLGQFGVACRSPRPTQILHSLEDRASRRVPGWMSGAVLDEIDGRAVGEVGGLGTGAGQHVDGVLAGVVGRSIGWAVMEGHC